MKSLECIKCGTRVAWVTFWVNVVGTIFKAVIGYLGGSKALLADAFHSAADAIIGIVTVVSLKISGKSPDKIHPYGHGKVEFIAAAAVTFALFIAVIFLFKGALDTLRSGTVVKPHLVTLFAAIVAMITSEMLFRYNLCAGKNLNSPVLIANAWHNRYDVYTSMVVAVGIIGAKMGLHYLDPIAAICVGIIIVRVTVQILRDAYKGLMDTTLPEDEKEKISKIIKRANGNVNLVYLKTRRAGQKIWIDIGIRLDPKDTVSEGYDIIEAIRNMLFLKLENVGEVQVEVIPG